MTLIALLLCIFNCAFADDSEKNDDPISWNFDITSNYVWSGISQSNNDPAVQAGLTYTFKNGIYLSAWGSNVNFPDVDGNTVAVEFDTWVGYRGQVNDDLSYDISFYRYNYPSAEGVSYNEFILTGTYKIMHATIGYSNDEFASDERGVRYEGGIAYDIPEDLLSVSGITLVGNFGHFDLPRKIYPSYNYYSAGLSKTFKDNLKIQLLWSGTNGHAYQSPFDKNRLVATIGMNF